MNAKKAKLLKNICQKTGLSYKKAKELYNGMNSNQKAKLSLAISEALETGKKIIVADPEYKPAKDAKNTAMTPNQVIKR